jgi:hypothetical protein
MQPEPPCITEDYTMTDSEVSAKVNQLVERALDANDARLAAAERQFCQVTGLADGDETDKAIGNLAGAIGAAYSQAVTAALWTGHNSR